MVVVVVVVGAPWSDFAHPAHHIATPMALDYRITRPPIFMAAHVFQPVSCLLARPHPGDEFFHNLGTQESGI